MDVAMAATEKRSREDWQELDKNHHLHPFTDHKELHEKRSRIITRAEGVYIYDADGSQSAAIQPGVLCRFRFRIK
jgi:putrescine aminotransferase